MNPQAALIFAVATGALAVAIVSVDLAYTLTASLDELRNGSWTTIDHTPRDAPRSYIDGCATQHLRLRVDNHKPLPDKVHVFASYNGGPEGSTQTLLSADWSLGAFEKREQEFTVPDSAFGTTGTNPKPNVYVTIQIGSDYLNHCVEKGA